MPDFAGGGTDQAFVKHVYRNVIGVDPSAGELAYYAGLLDGGVYTQAQLGLLACQSGFNTMSADLVGLASTGIEFAPPG